MSLLYYGGTDCPTCGATIPKGEPCQICALRAQLTERDREIERRVPKSAYQGMAAHANEGWRLYSEANSLLSASQAREREAEARANEYHDLNCKQAQRFAECESALLTAKADLERAREEERERIIALLMNSKDHALCVLVPDGSWAALWLEDKIRAALAHEQKG